MWHAVLTRREMLEALFGVSKPKAYESEDRLISVPFPKSTEEFLVCWKSDPSLSGEFPFAIVCDDGAVRETYAVLGSSPQVPSPLSAFCRVIPVSIARAFDATGEVGQLAALDGLVGTAMAEAAYYAGPLSKTSDLSVSACERTLTFSLARALCVCPPTLFDDVGNGWFQAQEVLSLEVRPAHLEKVGRVLPSIVSYASRLYYEIEAADDISRILEDIVKNGEPSESAWAPFAQRLPDGPSIRSMSSWPREERASYFQRVIKDLYSGKSSDASDMEFVAAAIVGSRIAPGSFEHLAIVCALPTPRLALWYAFVAGLQRDGAALKAYGGLGVRIRRDAQHEQSLYTRPACDVAIDELRLCAKSEFRSLFRRTSSEGQLRVELAPLVTCEFPFAQEVGARTAATSAVQSSLSLESSKSLPEKLQEIRDLLAEFSKDLARETPQRPKSRGRSR